MILRILLYIFYIFIPLIIIFVTSFAINISSNKDTIISYSLSSKNLINPNYIYYVKPEDIMYKNPYYSSDEIIEIMNLNEYLDQFGKINFDLKNLCDLDFSIEKKEIKKLSLDELLVSIHLFNPSDQMLEQMDNCINLFIEDLNNLLFFKFYEGGAIKKINYNINVLNLLTNSKFSNLYFDTEKYYSETRAQIIINTLNLTDKILYETIEELEALNIKSNNNQQSKILNELINKLNNQKNILLTFNIDPSFSDDIFSFTPEDEENNILIYYNHILTNLNNLKSKILNNQVSLKINNVNINKNINIEKNLITPGFILFVLLISSFIIIIIEFLYRKFRN